MKIRNVLLASFALLFVALFAASAAINAAAVSQSSAQKTCPIFYYYNATAKTCQPQTLSSACLPNSPNSPINYLCQTISASVCPTGYTFNSTTSQCLINNGKYHK